MHQPTLVSFLRGPSAPAEDVCTESLECYDFFCGCGGWSTGATQAGHRVVFACDYSEDAIAAHQANHPEAEHLQAELPLPRRRLPFPKDGRKFHVHGSPPCTLFSTMNSKKGGESEARHAATRLVSWYLRTALKSGCTSWTMEQVPSKVVLAVVERFRLKHRAQMDYGVFDFYDLGVPQRRKRLLAGTPALIARLKRMACHGRRRSARDVLPDADFIDELVSTVARLPGDVELLTLTPSTYVGFAASASLLASFCAESPVLAAHPDADILLQCYAVGSGENTRALRAVVRDGGQHLLAPLGSYFPVVTVSDRECLDRVLNRLLLHVSPDQLPALQQMTAAARALLRPQRAGAQPASPPPARERAPRAELASDPTEVPARTEVAIN